MQVGVQVLMPPPHKKSFKIYTPIALEATYLILPSVSTVFSLTISFMQAYLFIGFFSVSPKQNVYIMYW